MWILNAVPETGCHTKGLKGVKMSQKSNKSKYRRIVTLKEISRGQWKPGLSQENLEVLHMCEEHNFISSESNWMFTVEFFYLKAWTMFFVPQWCEIPVLLHAFHSATHQSRRCWQTGNDAVIKSEHADLGRAEMFSNLLQAV